MRPGTLLEIAGSNWLNVAAGEGPAGKPNGPKEKGPEKPEKAKKLILAGGVSSKEKGLWKESGKDIKPERVPPPVGQGKEDREGSTSKKEKERQGVARQEKVRRDRATTYGT